MVSPFVRRLVVVVVSVVALGQSSWAACGGWQATAEARRACCAQRTDCGPHEGRNTSHVSPSHVSQAAADDCCAAAEPRESAPPDRLFVLDLTLALSPSSVLVPLAPLAPPIRPPYVERVGLRAGPIPKHLLLSVFLV